MLKKCFCAWERSVVHGKCKEYTLLLGGPRPACWPWSLAVPLRQPDKEPFRRSRQDQPVLSVKHQSWPRLTCNMFLQCSWLSAQASTVLYGHVLLEMGASCSEAERGGLLPSGGVWEPGNTRAAGSGNRRESLAAHVCPPVGRGNSMSWRHSKPGAQRERVAHL